MTKKRVLGALALLIALCALGFWSASAPDIPHEVLVKRYAPAPSAFLKLPDGARAHYRDQGPKTAPVVVLLHGSNSSLHTWEGWVKALTPAYRVVTVDLPGHGLTGAVPSGDYSYEGMKKFLHAFLKARGIKTLTLGGNSMGGALTWKYTLAHPKQVKRLILVDAAGVPRSQKGKLPLAFRIAKIPVLSEVVRFITPRHLAAEGIKRCFGDPSKVTEALIDRYYDLTLHPGNRAAMIKRFSGYRELKKVPPLHQINAPTLILWGAKDTVTTPDMADVYAKHIKGSKRIMYQDLGHVPMEEAPARTVKDVLAFFKATAPPAPRANPAPQPAPAPRPDAASAKSPPRK